MKHLIRKILRESENDFDWANNIDPLSWKISAESFGDVKAMIKDLYNNDPMNFLLSLPKLEPVQSKARPGLTFFRYKTKENLMAHSKRMNALYINEDKIWSVLEDHFGLNYTETQQLTKRWVDEVYNIRDLNTIGHMNNWLSNLDEVYNLK